MYAPVFTGQMPARVLFLSRGESTVRLDVATLRNVGVTAIVHLTNRDTAVDILSRNADKFVQTGAQGDAGRLSPSVNLIICAEELADCTAMHFLRDMAAHPLLAHIPFLVLTATADAAEMYRGLGVQALARPYAANDLTQAMTRAVSPMRRPLRLAMFPPVDECRGTPARSSSSFASGGEGTALASKSPTLSSSGASRSKQPGCPSAAAKSIEALKAPTKAPTVTDRFNAGMGLLQRGREKEAEHAFLDTLNRNPGHADACLALARIYRARDDAAATTRYLIRAAATLHKLGETERAETVTRMLPPRLQNGNIRLHEAVSRMEHGEYRAAAAGLLGASREEQEPLHSLVARACTFTPNPKESLAKLCDAFESLGNTTLAVNLRRRLLDDAIPDLPPGHSWLDKFPVLREVVNVAGYAAWAWRKAG